MKFRSIVSRIIILFMAFASVLSISGSRVYADSYKVVTLGGDLTSEQKEDMLEYFEVTKEDADILEVHIDEEKKYLSDVATSDEIGTKSISCAYIEPTTS
jgi:uncharacterized protein YpuA (DUF1002 family)